MTREQAINYLRSSGFSEEQIQTVCNAIVEFCEDCISRKATIHALGKVQPLDYNNAQAIKARIEQLPSVQPTRAKGEWIDDCGKLKCSECGAIFNELYEMRNRKADNYCPCCGADMREGETDGTLD